MKRIQRIATLRPPMPWHQPQIRESKGETVIILHGLWRSIWAMEPMSKHLHQEGFHSINIPYPSFSKSIQAHCEYVLEVIEKHCSKGKIHFVTHSLGGIVARNLLPQLPEKNIGNIVMLAPPNQGSEIADWFEKTPLKHTLGPARTSLHTENSDTPHIPAHINTAVIMGKRSLIPFFKNLLDEENDGIVSVNRGKMENMNEFHVLDIDHTLITSDPEVMAMTTRFLRAGKTNC